MVKGIYLLDYSSFDKIYSPQQRHQIASLIDIEPQPYTIDTIRDNLSVLEDVEVILSGWHMAKMDSGFLNAAPNLKAVFYGAGSTKYFITDQVWQRDIIICSAYTANAVPVAEFALAQILLSLKSVWYHSRDIRHKRDFVRSECFGAGIYGSTVGLISLGTIARYLCGLLAAFNVNIIAYDPYADSQLADSLNVRLCSLDDVFKRSDVVSLHTPLTPQTVGMIEGRHFMAMKPYSTFINTARGAIVDERQMIEALRLRSDITALLDVTSPEPPLRQSPLYDMENVIITPHIAGSMGAECRRMGELMTQELKRYLAGEPLETRIEQRQLEMMA